MHTLRLTLVAGLLCLGPTAATAAETLTVLTYDSFVAEWGPGPIVKAAFEAECACTLRFIGLEDGVAILNRLKLQGTSTTADAVVGLDNNLIAEAGATGLFAPHGLALALPGLPVAWADPTFLPYDHAHFAVVYDRERLADPPRSLAALVDGGAEAPRIIIEDPRTSTPGLGLLVWIRAVYGEEAGAAWSRLRPRVLTVTPGWSEAYGLFVKGEAPLVLSYTTSPAYHRFAEKSERYAALRFPEGHPLQIEVAAVLARSPRQELARQFLAVLLSPAVQGEIATTNWMLPAGATAKPLPPAYDGVLPPPRTIGFSPAEIAANRRAWTAEWLEAMSR